MSASDPISAAKGPITAVVFDMGGVLVELGPLPQLLGGGGGEADFWPRWLASPSVRRFERGQCGVGEFGRGVVEEMALTITPEEFIANFEQFPRGLFPGAVELVRSVAPGVLTAVLSNTNQLHWDSQPDAVVIQELCQRSYLSYQLDLVKPDAAIYQHVVNDLGRPGHEILFIDDNAVNVDGARAVGIRAEVAKGVDQARAVLGDYGVTDEA